MKRPDRSQGDAPTLRDLYPSLSDEELKEAEENLQAYVRLVLRIFDEVSLGADPDERGRFDRKGRRA